MYWKRAVGSFSSVKPKYGLVVSSNYNEEMFEIGWLISDENANFYDNKK